MHWFICLLVIIAIVLVVLAWRDHKEKPRLYFAVVVVIIILLIPCFQHILGLLGAPGH
jgi:heme A synthase